MNRIGACLAVVVLLGFLCESLQAVTLHHTIYQDTFSLPGDSPIAGSSPETSVIAGASWALHGQGFAWGGPPKVVNGQAWVTVDKGLSLPLSDAVGYTLPSLIQISAKLNVKNATTDDAGFARGIGLGFYAGPWTFPEHGYYPGFRGLMLQLDGDLLLVDYPDQEGPDVLATLAYPGAGIFDPLIQHEIAYTVDTGTGAIASIVYDGVSLSLTGTESLFLEPNVSRVGFTVSYTDDSSGDGSGLIDDFRVAAVPEPATLALFVLGIFGSTLFLRRLRQ